MFGLIDTEAFGKGYRQKMTASNFVTQTYKKYYVDREYEQVDLFRLLKEKWEINRAVYPGSFVHISPSFIFSDVVYTLVSANAE